MEVYESKKILKTRSSTKLQPSKQFIFKNNHLSFSPSRMKSSLTIRTEPNKSMSPSISDDDEQDYEKIKKIMILEIPKIKKKISIYLQRAVQTLEQISQLQVLLAASIKDQQSQYISVYQKLISENRKTLDVTNMERQRLEKSLQMHKAICFKRT